MSMVRIFLPRSDFDRDELSDVLMASDEVFSGGHKPGAEMFQDESPPGQFTPSGLYPRALINNGELPRVEISGDEIRRRGETDGLLGDEWLGGDQLVENGETARCDWLRGDAMDEGDSAPKMSWTRLSDEGEDSAARR